MAVYLITGEQGGGKTYRAVTEAKAYFQYDKEIGEYVPKDDIVIISNIDNLKLPHESLESEIDSEVDYQFRLFCRENGLEIPVELDPDVMEEDQRKIYYSYQADRVKWFFNYETQKRICTQYKKVVYLVDEAQDYFDGTMKYREVISMFHRHRHLGLDFYLVTPHRSQINKNIVHEKEIRACPRSIQFTKEFKYIHFVRGKRMTITPDILYPKKQNFGLYKSMDQTESVKMKKPWRKFMVLPLVVICLWWGVKKAIYGQAAGETATVEASEVSEPGGKEVMPLQKMDAEPIHGNDIFTPDAGWCWKKISSFRMHEGEKVIQYFVYDDDYYVSTKFPYDIKVSSGKIYAFVPPMKDDRRSREESSTSGAAWHPVYGGENGGYDGT